jgi:hypothetical protein
MSKSWLGEGELQNALAELSGQHPVPSSKIKHIVSIAFKYQNEFKMVVYEIEKYIKKASGNDKIGGLFVIDFICQQSRNNFGKEKDLFSNRFSIRLKETINYLEKCGPKDKVFKLNKLN